MSGTELEVAEKYLTFDMRLKDKGYRRMTTFKGTGGRNFNLPWAAIPGRRPVK
jgi:hypothetical protein